MMQSLSVIIVNYEAWNKLSDCLGSLLPLLEDGIVAEVVVVDNQSPSSFLAQFKSDFPQVNFYANDANRGFAQACNYGASLAVGEVFLFLNPDTIVNAETISAMMKIIGQRELTILSCQQTDEGGRLSKSGAAYKQFGFSKLKKKETNPKEISPGLFQMDWVSGSVFMMQKSGYERYGGWNEDFWMYCEDEDFCRRVNEGGGQVALLSEPTIIHAHGGSSRLNVKVSALTKTEVLISTHIYFSHFVFGLKGVFLQGAMVFYHLLAALLECLLALPLFFLKKARVRIVKLAHLLHYYVYALLHLSWKSPRNLS